MDRVGAGDLAGREQGGDVEIALARRRRADADALVGEPHMHGIGIGGRMDRDGGDAELLGGAQHAQRDLAAVGDQDLVEHASRSLDHDQGLAVFDRLAVLDQDRGDHAGARRDDLVEGLHRLDEQDLSPALTVLPISTKALASGWRGDRRCRPWATSRRRGCRRPGVRRGGAPRGGRCHRGSGGRQGGAQWRAAFMCCRVSRTRRSPFSISISTSPVSSISCRQLAQEIGIDGRGRRAVARRHQLLFARTRGRSGSCKTPSLRWFGRGSEVPDHTSA